MENRSKAILGMEDSAFARSLFKSMGYTDSELKEGKPLIGIANTWNTLVPGHYNLDKVAEYVKNGIYAAGGTAVEFGTIAACDGVAQGHEGMHYILPSREIICDSVEIMAQAHRLDGLVLGINECGYPMSSLLSAYQEDIDTLKRLQPDATIYLLKVYGVSRSVAESASYFSPQRLQEVNDGIAGLSDGKKVRCLDASHLYCDDEGYMKEEYTSDGIHPYAKDAALFAQWLCQQISGGR